MIIVRIIGGLGNQMFQYAAGRALAKHHGMELRLDVSGFRSYRVHGYELSGFLINASEANEDEVAAFLGKSDGLLRKIHSSFLRFSQNRKPHAQRRVYSEPNLLFDEKFFDLSGVVYLSGYFQGEKYFSNIVDELRHEFVPKAKLGQKAEEILGRIKSSNAVSLHVRRGDYITNTKANALHGTCEMAYYRHCMSAMEEKVKTPHYFAFSDDIDWVRENIKADRITYVDGTSGPIEDMFLMSQCQHNIVANSTFSWWGAWLNASSEKIVFAPKKWFNDASLDDRDLVPPQWARI